MALYRTVPDPGNPKKGIPPDPQKCIHVPLTAEEEAVVRAEWRANEERHAAEAAKPKEPTLAERVAALETKLAAAERAEPSK